MAHNYGHSYDAAKLGKKYIYAAGLPAVQAMLKRMNNDGVNPKTMAALKTVLVQAAGLRARDAERFAEKLVHTMKWGVSSPITRLNHGP